MQQIARVIKSNGTEGDILVGFRGISPDEISPEEPVFIEFDGLPVPFFIQAIEPKGNSRAIIHLNDVCNLKDAEELVGRFILGERQEEDEDEFEDYYDLIGWSLKGVGKITDFLDIPSNPCLEVETKKGAVIVPLHEDLIIAVRKHRKEIEMEIPDGLLDL